MTSEEADKLQEQWGDKRCDHPDIIAEHGTETDDDKWRCIQCGRLMGFDEWRTWRREVEAKLDGE